MFVVFEGIDGSGKTTLSNRAAAALTELGLRVTHVRPDGRMASDVAEGIRQFSRDQRNLALTPFTELLLYVARERQQLEEVILPALSRSDIVIADRFLHSAEVLARYGRGLPAPAVDAVLAAASQGCAPDLVILVSVDPHVALARRRVEKILRPQARSSSRKGVSGAGLMHRLRDGYFELARRDPARWLVVDNTEAEMAVLVETVVAAIRAARTGGVAAAHRAVGGRRRRRRTGSDVDRLGATDAATDPESARARFLAWLDSKSQREPAVAAYLLGGLWGDGFDERRRRLASAVPEIIAGGLRGLDDAVSWELRRALAAVTPHWVARSLAGIDAACPLAWNLRERLAASVADDVAASLEGLSDERAWALRDRLWGTAPDPVVQSLGGDDSPRAWALRERWLARHGGEACLGDPARARIACSAVRGLGSGRAWQLRGLARPASPVGAILSLAGVGDDRAWRWREGDLGRAPRPVLQTIQGSDDRRAWALRELAAPRSKEALDSIIGMDQPQAWSLRERFGDLWPSTAVKSLGELGRGERGRRLIEAQLLRQPDNLSLLKHAAALAGACVMRRAAAS